MNPDDLTIQSKEVTTTKHYVEVGGEEYSAAKLIDFLEQIEGTDSMFPLTWTREFEDEAELFIDHDIVGKTARGSWFIREPEQAEAIRDELLDQFAEVQ